MSQNMHIVSFQYKEYIKREEILGLGLTVAEWVLNFAQSKIQGKILSMHLKGYIISTRMHQNNIHV